MKLNPQLIIQDGVPLFAVLAYADYQSLQFALQEWQELKAEKVAREKSHEEFPLQVRAALARGEPAVQVFRQYRGISQTELAKRLKVSRQYISQIEKGERSGSAKILKNIAKALAVSLDELA